MKIPIEHFSFSLDAKLVEADIHWWGMASRNEVDFD
jgi:hypothetical protein